MTLEESACCVGGFHSLVNLYSATMFDSLYNLLTVDFLIRLVGGSDNGQLELVLVISNWLALFELLLLLIISIIVMRKTKVLFGGCNVDFALSVGCNDFALGVVMIILFYKIK